MKRIFWSFLGAYALFFFVASEAAAIKIKKAEIKKGAVEVKGDNAAEEASITWEGVGVATSDKKGKFEFSTANLPQDCVGELSDGVNTIDVVVMGCRIEVVEGGGFLVTGQTTAYQADKNDGVGGAVDVPDDGTLQMGAPLQYQDNGDGTIADLNTGLMWEKKLAATDAACINPAQTSRDLHCVNNFYVWSGNGAQETIWDWLDDLNASNYAGFSDWRIPNQRELQSIVDYGRNNPAISPIFGPAFAFDAGGASQYRHWSSTTRVCDPAGAWFVDFLDGSVPRGFSKANNFLVRVVRGGQAPAEPGPGAGPANCEPPVGGI